MKSSIEVITAFNVIREALEDVRIQSGITDSISDLDSIYARLRRARTVDAPVVEDPDPRFIDPDESE